MTPGLSQTDTTNAMAALASSDGPMSMLPQLGDTEEKLRQVGQVFQRYMSGLSSILGSGLELVCSRYSVLLCSPVFCAAAAAPAAHPEAAAAEELLAAGERSAGGSFWTRRSPCCFAGTHPWFCHTTSLVPGGLLHCSSSRPVWTSAAPLPWHFEAWWSSSPEVPWRFSRGAAEGVQPQRGSFPQAEPPQRAVSSRTPHEVRAATKPGPGLCDDVFL